ncbi:MAG TPA: hypothetical protein VH024_00340 [Candidatus Angelobacter sp.]|jgi:ABC-type phosphate transport system permease subunit|nr:hypothetical protein [Candidatus Angelobacter sp.]
MPYSFLESALVPVLKRLPSSLMAKMQSRSIKAIFIVLSLLLSTFLMGWIAFATSHSYLPLAVLGVFYGVMLSYPATKLLGPRLQSALGGLLGGISLGNIGSRVAKGESAIRSLSKFITNTVGQALSNLPGGGKAQLLEDGFVLCIWMAIVTMFLIIATNVYLGESTAAAKAPVAPGAPVPVPTPAAAVVPANNAIGVASGSQG